MERRPKSERDAVRPLPRARRVDLTDSQKQAIQQLLFGACEVHTLAEALARYRTEYLDVETLARSTISWRLRAVESLTRYGERDIRGRFRDVGAELYRRHGECVGSMACNTLARVLILARRWGWRDAEHDLQGISRVRSKQRTIEVPADQIGQLIKILRRQDGRRGVAASACLLALWTGARIGEICSAEWGSVSLTDCTLTIRRSKTKRPRIVPLCTEAVELLSSIERESPWVFTARDGLGPIDRRQCLHEVTEAGAELGLKITPHVLRHTWASQAMRAGVPDEVAARVLGHSTTKELQRYQHARTDDLRAAITVVAKRVGGTR